MLVLLMVVVVKSISIMEMEPLMIMFYLDEGQVFKVPLWRRILMEMEILILLVLLMVVVVKSISIMEMEPLVVIPYLDDEQVLEVLL